MKVSFFADVDNIQNKRGSDELIVKLITQEISDENAGLIMGLRNKYVNVALSVSKLSDDEIHEMPDEFAVAPALKEKSQSQRLRGVLYRQWESRYKTRYLTAEAYYEARMEQIIEAEKERI